MVVSAAGRLHKQLLPHMLPGPATEPPLTEPRLTLKRLSASGSWRFSGATGAALSSGRGLESAVAAAAWGGREGGQHRVQI